jgi:hypothetical protein
MTNPHFSNDVRNILETEGLATEGPSPESNQTAEEYMQAVIAGALDELQECVDIQAAEEK